MMYQLPTDSQRLAVANFRKFVDAEIRPVAGAYSERVIPTERLREITQMIAEFGLPGAALRSEAGGLGLGHVTQAMLIEELMTVSAEIGLAVMTDCSAAELLSEAQSPLRDRYLPGLLSGRLFGCLARPEQNSNAASCVTSTRHGDHFTINGSTAWVPNAFHSDFVICAIQAPATGQSYILVDRHEHGYEVTNIGKNGNSSPPTARIVFENLQVPAWNLIVTGTQSLDGVMTVFDKARIHTAMLSVGLMRAALDEALGYVRAAVGGSVPAPQLVAARLGEMATIVDAARLLCFRAFVLMDAGTPCDVEASMANWFATEMSARVCNDAVRLCDGESSAKALDIERLTRDARVVPAGSVEMHKLIISQSLTGRNASP